MKIRALIGFWLVLLLGLAMCGAGLPDVGLSSNRGRMDVGLKTSLANGGGGAGWDTVVVLLSTQAPAAIAGPDTFALPSSPSGTTSPPTLDYARIYEMNDYVLGRGAKSWRGDSADAATVLRLGTIGTNGDVPSFAYAEIDSLRPLWAKDPVGTICGMTANESRRVTQVAYNGSGVPTSVDSVAVLDIRTGWLATDVSPADRDTATWGIGRPHFELVYVPFEDIIPANASIVSATINVSPNSNYYIASPDSVVATLMTNPNDEWWYQQKGIANHTDIAETCWRRQWTSSQGSGAQNGHPWDPALSTRKYLWDWGKVSDWTGSTYTGGNFIPQYTNTRIEITNCVQAAVAGQVNNGILLSYAESARAGSAFKHYNWDRTSNTSVNNRTPYIVIKYVTRRYAAPFGSSDIGVVLNTDDGVYDANTEWADELATHTGARFTMFEARDQLGVLGKSTMAQLLSFYDRGFIEIGSHSRYHKVNGLTYWQRNLAMADTNAAAFDSLLYDCSPQWMYVRADAEGRDMRGAAQFGKSLALPENQHSPWVLLALKKIGYNAIRTGSSAGTYDRVKYFHPATLGAARTDSLWMGGFNYSGRYARNMQAFPFTMNIPLIVGAEGNKHTTQAEYDSVSVNMSRALFQTRGQNRGVLNLFWHDTKKVPTTGGYNEGVDAIDLSVMCDVIDAWGAKYLTISDAANYRKGGATAAASPNRAAVPDTFETTAGERVWFRPNGVDQRWIRNVR